MIISKAKNPFPNKIKNQALDGVPASHLAVLDPEKKSERTLFSLLNMESPKVQKVSHWLSKAFIVEASYPHVKICEIPGTPGCAS